MSNRIKSRLVALENAPASRRMIGLASIRQHRAHFEVETLDGGRIAIQGGSDECAEWMASGTINGVPCQPYDGPAKPHW